MMKIVKTVSIKLTEEERQTLQKAQDILIAFEIEASASDEETLQDMYEEHVNYYQHEMALSTAIDLLGTILDREEED
jgi:hypothetical protein